jgi:hypothetical protein
MNRLILAFVSAAALSACTAPAPTPTPTSSAVSKKPTTSEGPSAPANSTDTGGNSSVAPSASASAAPAASPTIAAPTLVAVDGMEGALHVSWNLPKEACDSIEAERKAEMSGGMVMDQYKVVFSAPSGSEDHMDGTATDDMTYTYRLRCKVGSQYSKYSNEMGGNPTK